MRLLGRGAIAALLRRGAIPSRLLPLRRRPVAPLLRWGAISSLLRGRAIAALLAGRRLLAGEAAGAGRALLSRVPARLLALRSRKYVI